MAGLQCPTCAAFRDGVSTIGGVLAANAWSAVQRARRGCSAGVRFVDGTGTVVKDGGQVMKNVTGYIWSS